MSVEFFQSIVMIHFHEYYAFFSSKQQIKKPVRFESNISNSTILMSTRDRLTAVFMVLTDLSFDPIVTEQ